MRKFYWIFMAVMTISVVSFTVVALVVDNFFDVNISTDFNGFYTTSSGFLRQVNFTQTRSVNLSSEAVITAVNITLTGFRQHVGNLTFVYNVSTLLVGDTGNDIKESQTVADSDSLYLVEQFDTFYNITKLWKENATKHWTIQQGVNSDVDGLARDNSFLYACVEETTGNGAGEILKLDKTDGSEIGSLSSSCSANTSTDGFSISANNTEGFLYSIMITEVRKINTSSMTINTTLSIPTGGGYTNRPSAICQNTNMVFAVIKNTTFGFNKTPFVEIWNSTNFQPGIRTENVGCIADETKVFLTTKGQANNVQTLQIVNATHGGINDTSANNDGVNFVSGCGDFDSSDGLNCPYFIQDSTALNKADLSTNFSYSATSSTNDLHPDGVSSIILGFFVDADEGILYSIRSVQNAPHYIMKFENTFPTNLTIDVGNDGDKDYVNSSLNDTVFVVLSTSEFSDYLSSNCDFGWCEVPINFSVNRSGITNISQFSLHWTDNTAPVHFNNVTNVTTFTAGNDFRFNVNISDGTNLSSTTFGWDGAGACSGFTNDTTTAFSTTTNNYSFSVIKTVGCVVGDTVTLRQYSNDSFNNFNIFSFSFEVENNVPSVNQTLNYNQSHNLTIVVDINATDADSHVLEYFLNSSLSTLTIDIDTGLINHSSNRDEAGQHRVNISVSDSFENSTIYFWYNISDANPAATNLTILPSSATPADDLRAEFNYTDTDNDVYLSNSTDWFINGEIISIARNQSLLTSGNTTLNDNVILSVQVLQVGGITRGFVNTTSLVIENNAPSVNQTLNYNQSHNLTLVVDVNATDADSHPLEYFINSSLLTLTIDITTGLINHSSNRGETGQHRVNISVSDGFENSTIYFWYNISDSNPAATNLTIIPSPADPTDDLRAEFNYTDTDNDAYLSNSTDWFINGAMILTARNRSLLTSDNTSLDDNVTLSVQVIQVGGLTRGFVNTTPLVVGDVATPNIFENFTHTPSVQRDSIINISVNVSDDEAQIDTVNILVTNPNQAVTTLSASLVGGTNQPGEVSLWRATFTTSVVGTHNVNFSVKDGSGNIVTAGGSLTFEVTSPPSGNGGGISGGGGGGDIITVINQTTITPFCGDNVCTVSIGEDILSCPQDCLVGDTDFQGFVGRLGVVPKIVLAITAGSLLVLAFREDVRRRLAKGLKGGKRLRGGVKHKFRRISPEGFGEGRRVV